MVARSSTLKSRLLVLISPPLSASSSSSYLGWRSRRQGGKRKRVALSDASCGGSSSWCHLVGGDRGGIVASTLF